MVSKITTVSLNDEDLALIEHYNLSPTALIKERLAQFRQIDTYAASMIKELHEKIERMTVILDNQYKIIEGYEKRVIQNAN